MKQEFLRFTAVRDAVGLSRSTIFRMERDGKFPARRQLSKNSVGWRLRDIEEWIESREMVVSGNATGHIPRSPGRPPKCRAKNEIEDNTRVVH